MTEMTYRVAGQVGEWTFYRVDNHGFTGDLEDKPLFTFGDGSARDSGSRQGQPRHGEMYDSLEYAMVAAVGEKYTGKRGAAGTGVGTAADWFMRMIGAV